MLCKKGWAVRFYFRVNTFYEEMLFLNKIKKNFNIINVYLCFLKKFRIKEFIKKNFFSVKNINFGKVWEN